MISFYFKLENFYVLKVDREPSVVVFVPKGHFNLVDAIKNVFAGPLTQRIASVFE